MKPLVRFMFPVLAASSLFLAACDPNAASNRNSAPKINGGVAVIDLDAVAKRLGRDVEITQALKDIGDTLSGKLGETQRELQGRFEQSKQSIGANPSEEENRKLAEFGRTLNLQLQQKQQEAQTELNAKRVALVTRFREEVKPVASEVAAGKGLGTVLIKNDAVLLTNGNEVDITDEVTAILIRSTPSSAASPAATATATPGL